MKIGIIDADLLAETTHFPNLVCMKISSYFKKNGNDVELILSYDDLYATPDVYDVVFASKVFTDTPFPEKVKELGEQEKFALAYGGTGFFYDKATPLPSEVEHTMPDYGLYGNYLSNYAPKRLLKPSVLKNYTDYSIGFTTRGCIRHCEFCVNKNANGVIAASPVWEFLDESRPKIMLLDDNILAYPKWREVFEELQSTNKRFTFKQGMDIRLMTREKAQVIAESKYDGDYIFAFDDYSSKDIIVPKLEMFSQYTKKIPMFYLLCGYKSVGADDVAEIFERLIILWRHNAIGYLMRFKNVYGSKHESIYTQLSRWINQPQFQKKLSFREFIMADDMRVKTKKSKSRVAFEAFEKEYPDVARKYFDLKRE